MSISVPVNANGEPASTRDFHIARGAGGRTWGQMIFRGLDKTAQDTHYLDEHTDLWIPRGVLLFRPWLKAKTAAVKATEEAIGRWETVAPAKPRDQLQLDD